MSAEKIEPDSSEYSQRLVHLDNLERAGINLFPAEPPRRTHSNAVLKESFKDLSGSIVSSVGRMISKRVHGGLTFAHIDDASAAIQTIWQRDVLGDRYPLIRDNFDIGDFVGVTGILKTTKTREVSVWAQDVTMLTKALRVIPHALEDPEIQQRQRYLHTLIDAEARNSFRVRSQLVQSMRDYFIQRMGCLEVETPILDLTYGGANAKPFVTHHNALGEDLYLRISNELYLKRMTVGGFYEGVFEFSRDFRNEGMDRTHNPEFTQVELYKPWWDYGNMMDTVEDLMSGIVRSVHHGTVAPFNEQEIDYSVPWRRLTVYDGIRQKLGIDPKNASMEELQGLGRSLGIKIKGISKGEVCLELFEALWEHELIQPTFVKDYPADTSALTKRHREDPDLTERFELFVGGMEVANCYTELNDPRDQRCRFEIERRRGEAGDAEAMPYDEDFIKAMEYGMPPQAGIGISIDRWTMLLTNTPHIRGVIYFPTLKRKV